MGAGTPGCLETREVGNAPSSKQPGWNKTPKDKNREAGYGNKIKSIALPCPGAEWGTPYHHRAPQCVDGADDVGVNCCTHQCVPSSRCLFLPTVLCAGPSPTALTGPSCLLTERGSIVWDTGMGLHPTLPCLGSDPRLGADPVGDKGHHGQDQVLAEEGTKMSLIPWPGFATGRGGCRPAPTRRPLDYFENYNAR